MNFIGRGRRGAALLLILIFGACKAETPRVMPSALPTKDIATPLVEAEETAELTPLSTPSPVVTEDCARGDYFDELESGAQVRQYLLHVPATYKAEQPSALVLVFHGAGPGAQRFADYSRFSTVADREGFLVVYPQGLGERPAWNPSPGSGDIQFVRDLIDHLQRRCNVNPGRIYATGHSNGGGMVHRLACDLADRIAAIGPVSGAYPSGQCSPSRPVPVFAIHGIADPIVPYEGIPDWASTWAARNGCDPEPAEVIHNVLIGEQQWKNCRDGADVILYTIQDLGHDWTHDLINFGQTLWDFFEQHPL